MFRLKFSYCIIRVERNNFNSCILLTPKKASRHDIKNKAYLTEDRQIIKEIDFQIANISSQEASFVQIIIDLLSDGEMNQSEIIKYLKQISFFTKYSIGEKKVIAWLEKWANNGTWCCEKRLRDKNFKNSSKDSLNPDYAIGKFQSKQTYYKI